MSKLFKKAFTLIELLVVIAIVGILSGLIVVSMSGMTQKAVVAKARIFSSSLRNSLMINLVSDWKLDDASGTVAADTWGTNNGTLTSFADTTAGYGDANTSGWVSSSNCVFNTCLKFDGTDDRIVFGSATKYSQYTIEVWLNGLRGQSAGGFFTGLAEESIIAGVFLLNQGISDQEFPTRQLLKCGT
jgi:prepilin-type N-terminal cleavage/methylation domain-containing protein